MNIFLQAFLFVMSAILAGVLIWGYVRSKNLGFLLIALGLPVWNMIWSLVSGPLFTVLFKTVEGRSVPLSQLFNVISAAVNSVGYAFVLTGAILLVRGFKKDAVTDVGFGPEP